MTKERSVMLKLTDEHGVPKVNDKGKFQNLFLNYWTELLKHFWQAKRSLRKLKRQVYWTKHNVLKTQISADCFPDFPQAISAISALSQAHRSDEHERQQSRQVSAFRETFGKRLSRSSADFVLCGPQPGVFLPARCVCAPPRPLPLRAGPRRRAAHRGLVLPPRAVAWPRRPAALHVKKKKAGLGFFVAARDRQAPAGHGQPASQRGFVPGLAPVAVTVGTPSVWVPVPTPSRAPAATSDRGEPRPGQYLVLLRNTRNETQTMQRTDPVCTPLSMVRPFSSRSPHVCALTTAVRGLGHVCPTNYTRHFSKAELPSMAKALQRKERSQATTKSIHSDAFYSIVMGFGRFFNLHSHPSHLLSPHRLMWETQGKIGKLPSPVLACHQVSSASPIRRGTLGTANHDRHPLNDSLKKTYL